MLKIEELKVAYGAIQAIKGVSLEVREKEIVTLIGANGAGKTTIINTISALLKAQSGTIEFLGEKITDYDPRSIVKLGISQVPEGRRIFPDMTVYENLEMGAYLRKKKEEVAADLAGVYESFPILKERKNQLGGTLSGGEQQMLTMGRALMARPRLLLLDEPSMGLAPIFVQEIFSIIKKINESGTTILLVEQNAKMALSIADRAYVLETGKIVESGKAIDLLNLETIKKAYLGG